MIRCVCLVVLIYLVESTDYTKCGAVKSNNRLSCKGANLGAVPMNLPAALVELEIRDDNLNVIGGFEFPTLHYLRKLTLKNVNIGKEIPPLAFAKLTHLETLIIFNTDKVTIHQEAFHGLRRLKTVRLFNMGIESLPDRMFKDSEDLTKIYIMRNEITAIGRNTFQPLAKVQQLALQFNNISRIEEGAFDCMDPSPIWPTLLIITLSHNRLRTIPQDIGQDSRIILYIHNNPILCDCKLKIPLNFRDKKAKCEEPASLIGTTLISMARTPTECVCHPPKIVHGYADHDSPLDPGQRLQIGCNPGYNLDVKPVIVCQEDATFGDAIIPECKADTNEPVELDDGSLLIMSNRFSVYPGFVTLNCPLNAYVKSCQCVEFYCQGVVMEDTLCRVYGAPGNDTKGQLICTPGERVSLQYTYELTEEVTPIAACRPYYEMTACTNYIPRLNVSSNHGVLIPDREGRCSVDCGDYECDLYIRCVMTIQKQLCDKFSIDGGTLTIDGVEMTTSTKFEEGDIVTLTCNEDYELWADDHDSETFTMTCVEGDTYIPAEIPFCLEIIPECAVRRIPNVVAKPGWVVGEGEHMTLTCAERYEGEPLVVYCPEGGLFREPIITCNERAPAECAVGTIVHAELVFENGTLLSGYTVTEGVVITVSCDEGYATARNSTRLTCLPTGELDRPMPVCSESDEPEEEGCSVPLIRNGYTDDHTAGDSIGPGVVVTFHCNDGFQLLEPDTNELECVSNQYYEPNKLPICRKQEVRCTVPIIQYGYYLYYKVGQSILKDSVLWAECYEGYFLHGPDPIICSENNFGGEVNTCEKPVVDCVIPFIENGGVRNDGKPFKEDVSFPIVCDRGFWNPYSFINCVAGPQTYDPYSVPDCEQPKYGCSKVAFPFMKPLSDEPQRGDTIEVECMEGYTLIGADTITCGKFDYTANILPECRPSSGCEIPTIENGVANTTRSHLDDGERLAITCDSGHALYGDQVIGCKKGSWSGLVTPECRPDDEMSADCILPMVYDGYFIPLADSLVNPGSTLVLSCVDGYGVKDGFDKIMCVTSALFEPPVLPECVPLEVTGCPPPGILHSMTQPESGIRIGDTVFINCDDGYLLHGPDEITCETNGNYDEQPVCDREPAKCPVPIVTGGLTSPVEPIYDGESYLVDCYDGYELVGDESLFCGADGQVFGETTGQMPSCRKLPDPCDKPQILNGWLTVQQNMLQIPYMEDAFVVCHQPNYTPTQTQVTCMGNNQWSPPIPTCTWKGPTCPFPTIKNGEATPLLDEVVPWQTINITCEEGFEKNPNVNLECIYSGDVAEYNNKIPVCEQMKNNCVHPIIANGYINGPNPLTTDDRFTVECNEGFELVGVQGPLVCYQDEIYSRHLPYCQRKDENTTECYEPFVQNANIAGSPLTGYYITVVCDEGYSIEGPNRLQCLNNGQFDQTMPQCIKKIATGQDYCGQRDLNTDYDATSDTEFATADTSSDPVNGKKVRIYGGTDASPGEYPWNVLIEFSRGRFCGGSIVSKEWVLTAGHCILHNIWKKCNNRAKTPCRLMDPRDVIAITAGLHDRDEREDYWQIRTAVDVVAHTSLTSQASYIDFDVGLIKVNQPFEYGPLVNRVCLPKGVGVLMGNLNLTVSGWGKTNTSITSNILQKITVPYVKRHTCNANISYNGAITETMFCAGYPTGKIDACQGDSGGPLVYLGSNGTFVQGGIVSWGQECAMAHFYGVYTNLAYFHDWIMSYILVN